MQTISNQSQNKYEHNNIQICLSVPATTHHHTPHTPHTHTLQFTATNPWKSWQEDWQAYREVRLYTYQEKKYDKLLDPY